MRWIIVTALSAWFVLLGSTTMADTIYTWTDADGVKRYSNAQPPQGVGNVQTIEEVQYDDTGADRNRRNYEAMVKEASKAADRHFEQQDRKKAMQADAKRRREQEAQNQKIAEERARLMKEIEAIKQRGYSPTFTKGMQDNLIKEVQAKIDQLDQGSE
jgi:hypothetical protein